MSPYLLVGAITGLVSIVGTVAPYLYGKHYLKTNHALRNQTKKQVTELQIARRTAFSRFMYN